MVLSKALLSVRPSLLDERGAGLVAEAVVAEGAVRLARRPVVELQKQIVTQASRNVNVNSSGSHRQAHAIILINHASANISLALIFLLSRFRVSHHYLYL